MVTLGVRTSTHEFWRRHSLVHNSSLARRRGTQRQCFTVVPGDAAVTCYPAPRGLPPSSLTFLPRGVLPGIGHQLNHVHFNSKHRSCFWEPQTHPVRLPPALDHVPAWQAEWGPDVSIPGTRDESSLWDFIIPA